jgi:hypothetical protein
MSLNNGSPLSTASLKPFTRMLSLLAQLVKGSSRLALTASLARGRLSSPAPDGTLRRGPAACRVLNSRPPSTHTAASDGCA